MIRNPQFVRIYDAIDLGRDYMLQTLAEYERTYGRSYPRYNRDMDRIRADIAQVDQLLLDLREE